MKTLKSLIESNFSSYYAASKAFGIHATQLKRWADNEAIVDDYGSVFIKSKSIDIKKLTHGVSLTKTPNHIELRKDNE